MTWHAHRHVERGHGRAPGAGAVTQRGPRGARLARQHPAADASDAHPRAIGRGRRRRVRAESKCTRACRRARRRTARHRADRLEPRHARGELRHRQSQPRPTPRRLHWWAHHCQRERVAPLRLGQPRRQRHLARSRAAQRRAPGSRENAIDRPLARPRDESTAAGGRAGTHLGQAGRPSSDRRRACPGSGRQAGARDRFS